MRDAGIRIDWSLYTDRQTKGGAMTEMQTPQPIHDVIFDFCGVLLDWQCRACLQGHFDQAIVDRICADDDPCGFYHYEDRMDAGEDFADLIVEYQAEYGEELASIFRYYIEHYGDALPRMLPGMEALLNDIREAGLGVWGLTNWSHETFHIAFDKFPHLERLLNGTVVSGVEKMHKPNADIYELALRRFGINAQTSVFFDDTAKNIDGAHAVGLHAFRFTDAEQARKDLQGLGVALPTRN